MASSSSKRQSNPTLEAAELASREMENIVEALLGHAQVGGALKNKKDTVQKNDKTGGKFVHREEELSEAPRVQQKPRERKELAGRDDVL